MIHEFEEYWDLAIKNFAVNYEGDEQKVREMMLSLFEWFVVRYGIPTKETVKMIEQAVFEYQQTPPPPQA